MKNKKLLSGLYADHGVNLRKHNGEYPAWTARVPTVIDLDHDERRILDKDGDAALDALLRRKGQYPFPSLTIDALNDKSRLTILSCLKKNRTIICLPPAKHYRQMARAIAVNIRKLDGQPPDEISHADFKSSMLRRFNVIILGGAHENQAAECLTNLRWLNADAELPGPRGILIRTVHNPDNSGHNILQICCGTARVKEVTRRFRESLKVADGGSIVMPPTWQMECDPVSFAGLKNKKDVLAMLERKRRYRDQRLRPPSTVRELIKRAQNDFDSGGPELDRYNVDPLIIANMAADIFGKTGDSDYMFLYLETLRLMMRYFTATPAGASIPSDMEFYAGDVVHYWNLFSEHLPLTDNERLIITNLLLAVTEMCAGYKAARWPTAPDKLRHNHETFGALTLFFGGRYFWNYYRLPIAREWLRTARICFTGQIDRIFKYKENANSYQWLAPAHKLIYDRATDRNVYISNGCLLKIAENIIVTTDNFGHACDFGDAAPPISGGTLGAAVLDTAGVMHARSDFHRIARFIRTTRPSAVAADISPVNAPLEGCRYLPPDCQIKMPPAQPVTIMPLDDHIRRQYAPQVPRRKAYDKLALRGGWNNEAQYLLLEGYSYPTGGHAHRDQNTIIRLNHLGRIWLVDNSYGKLECQQGSAEIFRSRQLGPEDHNGIHFIQADCTFAPYPNLCELEHCHDYGKMVWIQSVLRDMADGEWRRNIFWLKEEFFLIIDRVTVGRDDLKALRCQWNILGHLKPAGKGLGVCSQKGCNFYIHHDTAPEVLLSSYCNANWRPELTPQIYPYARPPIQKMNQIFNHPRRGDVLTFANLFYAVQGNKPRFRMERTGNESWTVIGEGLSHLRLPAGGICQPKKGGKSLMFNAD